MQAIVFADRSSGPLAGVTGIHARALLPVAGKAVIEYALEALADAGLRDVVVFAGPDANRLRTLLAGGERWGMTVRIASSRGDEAPHALMLRLGQGVRAPYVAVRGDELRGRDVSGLDGDAAEAISAHAGDGWTVVGTDDNPVEALAALGDGARAADAQRLALDSAEGYHAACAAVMSGAVAGVARAGVQPADGLRCGRRALMRGTRDADGLAWIGHGTHVLPDARLRGAVSVESGSLIDRDAELEDCVVMPGTYVGESLSVRRAIVSARGVLAFGSDTFVPMPDSLWLAEATRSRERAAPSLVERALAAAALASCLPLAPLWLAGVLLRRLRGAATDPTQPTLFRQLFDVVRGRRLLVGAADDADGAGTVLNPSASLRLAGARPEELELATRLVNRLSLTERTHYWLKALRHARRHADVTPNHALESRS